MNDIALIIIVLVVAIGTLAGVAYLLERHRKNVDLMASRRWFMWIRNLATR